MTDDTSRTVRLGEQQYATIITAHGKFRVTATAEGIAVHTVPGGRLVAAPTGAHNGVDLIPWPSFQPIVPPTPERPVQVSRDLVAEVMAPRSNGVSTGAVAAVQDAVDAESAFRSMLDGIIHQTLTKRTSPGFGYEKVYVRGQEPGA